MQRVLCDQLNDPLAPKTRCFTCAHAEPHEPWLSHVSDARDCAGECGGVAVRCVPEGGAS